MTLVFRRRVRWSLGYFFPFSQESKATPAKPSELFDDDDDDDLFNSLSAKPAPLPSGPPKEETNKVRLQSCASQKEE